MAVFLYIIICLLLGMGVGALYIYFMNGDGTAKRIQKISAKYGDLNIDILPDMHLGNSVACLPDLDGDGVPDVVVGAPGTEYVVSVGMVYVLFLEVSGKVKGYQEISPYGYPDLDFGVVWNFGYSMVSIGDLNGDGIPDIAVGSPKSLSVWILFLRNDGTVLGLEHIQHVGGNNQFGRSMALYIDGNNETNIIVSDPVFIPGEEGTGILWFFTLHSNGTVKSNYTLSETDTPQLLEEDTFWGWGISSLIDFDNDGINEIAIGTPFVSVNGLPRTGAVLILFMNSNFTVKHYHRITQDEGGFTGHLQVGDLFGVSIGLWGTNTLYPRVCIGALFGAKDGQYWILEMDYTTISEGGFTNIESTSITSAGTSTFQTTSHLGTTSYLSTTSETETTEEETENILLRCGNISLCQKAGHCLCSECGCRKGSSNSTFTVENQNMNISDVIFITGGLIFKNANITLFSSYINSNALDISCSNIQLNKTALKTVNLELKSSNIYIDSLSSVKVLDGLSLSNSELYVQLTSEDKMTILEGHTLIDTDGDVSGEFDVTHIIVDGEEDDTLEVITQNNTFTLQQKHGDTFVIVLVTSIIGAFLIGGTIFILANKKVRSRLFAFHL
eukprot:TRINITY_DN3674_c0_g1_i6.p1 TRINITY_DN3674_c0_g1~~TRINITY_DN3674_c0_g1_i6.p1  ORF type:complete len:614 (+),score=133.75 TRINITY_DN3674_c0_g1_i6:248-2089(+)